MRNESDAVSGDCTFHQHVALVRIQQRAYLNLGDTAAGPVEYPLGPGRKKAQAAVFDQIARVPRHAVRLEIGGRCAQQALERAQGFIDDTAE